MEKETPAVERKHAVRAADVVFAGALLFLFGVFAAGSGWSFIISTLLAGVFLVGLYAALFKSRKLRYSVIFIFFAIGFFYYHFFLNFAVERQRIVFNKPIEFSGYILTEPKFSDKSQYFLFRLNSPFHGDARVVTKKVPEWNYGDSLKIQGSVIAPNSQNPLFNQPTVLFPKITHRGGYEGFFLKRKLIELKHLLIAAFRESLPNQQSALLAGLTLGWRGDFSSHFKDDMKKSGTTHLVALSGYNITILVLAIAATAGYFLSRRMTFYLTAAVITLFVLMVGGEASVIRSAIMGFLALFAREAGRAYSMRNAVVLTGSAMVIVRPTVLNFDVGFQLSFLALIGIVYLAPVLESAASKIKSKFFYAWEKTNSSFLGWKEVALTTLSAQLMVAPIIILQFDSISLTSLAANILILEFVPFTMALGFLLAGVSLLFAPLGALVGWFVSLLLAYEVWVIHFFARVSVPIGSAAASRFLFVFYYLLLFGLIGFVSIRLQKQENIYEKA